MKIQDIRCVLIVGSGTMGQEIGLQCAMNGYHVVLYDIAPDILETAMGRVKTYAYHLVVDKRLSQVEANSALARITMTTNPQKAAAEADLISESVPEDPKLKAKVFSQFHELCRPHTIFTTNTSMLLPSMLAKATGRPAQFAALHFHPHVWKSNVVDIMPHPKTSVETMVLLQEFAKSIGQIPILLKKESRGYVFNSMLSPALRAALELVVKDTASIEDVDRAFMGILKSPMGPFGIMDLIGLDTVWQILDYWARRAFFIRQLRRNANFLKEYVDRGHFGVKSGQGFYSYPNPAFQQPSFVKEE